MEPAPSAQIVGQEFVKQYYTMLNAAPEHLHRYMYLCTSCTTDMPILLLICCCYYFPFWELEGRSQKAAVVVHKIYYQSEWD